MIKEFADKETKTLFETGKSKSWNSIAKVAIRKLDQLNTATSLEALKVPPGNHLEALVADRKGQHSIPVNDKYRVCFCWKEDGVYEVEIVDYH